MIRTLRHIDKRIACPFFIGVEAHNSINCEGLSNQSLNVTKFDTREMMEKWLTALCCQTPQHCPVYQGIIRAKYNSISPPLRLRRDHSAYLDMK